MNDAQMEPIKVTAYGSSEDPKDFSEGGSEHRKALIANAALIVVLLNASKLNPALLGVEVSIPVLWSLIGISHIYFFCMWRITAPIELDSEKHFLNIKGLFRQAAIWRHTREFPGKTKAQLIFIRALPIWAFIAGLLGVSVGFSKHFCV